jgi:hypothetical protein
MPGKPSDFIIRVDGLNLDDSARARLAGVLQAAFMGELGRLDLAPRGGAVAYIPHKEWLGLWLRSIGQIKDLRGQDFDKTLNVGEQVR